jgi:hypothetical protein
MPLNSNEIFSRLLELYKTNKVNELSVLLGYTDSWGASTKKRGGIPYEACVIASLKFDVSMDYILFGKENNSIDINELKTSITEGIFAMMQSDMIELSKDVKISTMTNIITSEIVENCDIKTNEKTRKAI